MKTISEQRSFEGVQATYEHESVACAGTMRFSIFRPAGNGPVPVVYFLAGLECTEQTFAQKAGAQRYAAELGLAIVCPDTSPRKTRFDGDDASWDFGLGAGFYLDATQTPWSGAYRMRSYIAELTKLVDEKLPIRRDARGIFGHSMGGHGALTIALGEPGRYRSCSALSPICAPSQVPWGQNAFGKYLRERSEWNAYDACELLRSGKRFDGEIVVDQGTSDPFLARELKPELLEDAARDARQKLKMRRREGYDHGYYFVATFVEEHLRHHAAVLSG